MSMDVLEGPDGADVSIASVGSEVESRVHHLADQLRSKRKELSLLRHQQKKQKMEKLRAKESSMNKQIEVPIEYCFKKIT